MLDHIIYQERVGSFGSKTTKSKFMQQKHYHSKIIIYKILRVLSSCSKVNEIDHFGGFIIEKIAPVRICLFTIRQRCQTVREEEERVQRSSKIKSTTL